MLGTEEAVINFRNFWHNFRRESGKNHWFLIIIAERKSKLRLSVSSFFYCDVMVHNRKLRVNTLFAGEKAVSHENGKIRTRSIYKDLMSGPYWPFFHGINKVFVFFFCLFVFLFCFVFFLLVCFFFVLIFVFFFACFLLHFKVGRLSCQGH